MILYNPSISGSLVVTGSSISLNGVDVLLTNQTSSISVLSSSFALTSSYVLNAVSSSYAVNALTGSNAMTASSADTLYVRNNVTALGSITAQTLVVQTITSSVLFTTGSNKIGSSLSNVQELTGSVGITGSLSVNTNGTEFLVNAGGVNIGNALTDNHVISGSLRVNPNGLFVSSSGNVGIGTTSPTSLSQFQKFLHIDGGASNNSALCLSGQGLAGQATFGYDSNVLYIDALGAATGANNTITFNTTSVNSSNGRLERMRITSAGNVGIGDTSPTSNNNNTSNPVLSLKSTTAGAYPSYVTKYINGAEGGMTLAGDLYIDIAGNSTATNNNIIFRTTNTNSSYSTSERMRITSTGGLLINTTTSNSYPLELEAFTGGNQIYLKRDGANAKMFMGGSTGASTAFYIQASNTNGVYLTAGGTSWTANSDIHLKNIISPIDSAVDKLSTLNPVVFSWKSDDTNKENIGLIAQDVKEVFPQVIDTNEEGFLGVRYVELVPVLVKAIQELSAENNTLKEILQRNNIQ